MAIAPPEGEETSLPDRELGRGHRVEVGKPDEREQLPHLLAHLALPVAHPARPERGGERAVVDVEVVPDHQVLEHRHLREDAEQLERAGHAAGRDLVRLFPRRLFFVKARPRRERRIWNEKNTPSSMTGMTMVVVALVGVEPELADPRRRDPAEPVGRPEILGSADEEADRLAEPEGYEREVRPLEPERRNPDHHTGEHGDRDRDGERDPERAGRSSPT